MPSVALSRDPEALSLPELQLHEGAVTEEAPAPDGARLRAEAAEAECRHRGVSTPVSNARQP